MWQVKSMQKRREDLMLRYSEFPGGIFMNVPSASRATVLSILCTNVSFVPLILACPSAPSHSISRLVDK